jgi:DNA-binding transcriptional MerR regulator
MDGEPFAIGRLSDLTGVKVTTIRYYESIGLLPEPPRSTGNRRLYGSGHLDCLTFIRRARDFGLTLEAIGALLRLERNPDRDQSCTAATDIAETHLATIEHRIAELTALKAQLRTLVDACSGKRVTSCTILKALHDGSG